MQIEQKLKLEISDLNHEGFGVGKVDGYTLFIPGALPGEKIICKVIEVGKSFGFAEVVEIVESSPYRVRPRCDRFSECGGCELMHLEYNMQLQFKKKKAEETFKRIGHLKNVFVNEIIGMSEPYFYRNKIQVPCADKKGKLICGYYRKKSHTIIPLENCYIQPLIMTDVIKFIKNICNELKIFGYDEINKRGCLRYIMIRENHKKELMVVLVTHETKIKQAEVLVEKIIKRYPQIISIIHNVNSLGTNVILNDNYQVLYGSKYIEDEICNLKFNISYQSFFQVNPVQTVKLYNKVLEYADLHSDSVVIDGYCGVGTMSLLLAKKAKLVYGIEVVKSAIKNAKENAVLNNINNVDFIVGKVEDELPKYIDKGANTLVIDPPRKGLDTEVINTILTSQIKRIIYVSCDLATLARDLELLINDYNISRVCLVDMFCHTSSCETITLLERR